MAIDFSHFTTVVFIDANVALECLALSQLPWTEIDRVGPVLVLVAPTVLKEVDGKKNNARLGDHARRFNATLRPLISGQETVVIREAPQPRVELALARPGRINWDSHPDLDETEADAKIVAEATATRGVESLSPIFISHDIRPLDLAGRHGLRVFHIDDNWLRPKETSEAERKAAALGREVAALKSREPELILEWSAEQQMVDLYRLCSMTSEQRKRLTEAILRKHPMPEQENTRGVIAALTDYDHSMDRRYAKYEDKVIPAFVKQYEPKLEMIFGQVELLLTVRNTGKVQADSLLIKIRAEGGWLNEQFVWVSPSGPPPPRLRTGRHGLYTPPMHFLDHPLRGSQIARGRHEVVVELEPKRSREVQITCNDFRHGASYEYRLIAWPDPRSEENFQVTAIATAANLHGDARLTLTIDKRVTDIEVEAVVDMETLKLKKASAVEQRLNAAKEARDFSRFEADGADWDK
jgi:hypothetical protein